MPELEAFEAEVKNRIKQLASKRARTRRNAAAWLGESGDPTAITALAKTYRDDPDPQVREAARYALGMFRALEKAWEEDQDRVTAILEEVTLRGKMGRRVPVPPRRLAKLELALLLSAALVAAMAFGLPRLLRGGASAPADRDAQRAALVQTAQQLSADVEILRQQYQGVLAGAAVNCAAAFANPAISAAGLAPDLAPIAADLERAAAAFREAQTRFNQACAGGSPLVADEIGGLLGSLATVSQALAAADQALAAGAPAPTAPLGAPPAETPTVEVLAPPAAASPAEALAEPGQAAPDLRTYVSDLQRIVDTMTDLRGPVTALRQYWQEAASAGVTAGCSEPRPPLPPVYSLPSEIAAASQELMLATNLVSTGLKITQQNWEEFAAACAGGTLAATAAEGQRKADAAAAAFDSAAKLLAELRGS